MFLGGFEAPLDSTLDSLLELLSGTSTPRCLVLEVLPPEGSVVAANAAMMLESMHSMVRTPCAPPPPPFCNRDAHAPATPPCPSLCRSQP